MTAPVTGPSAALVAEMLAATRSLVGDRGADRFGIAVSGGPDSMALLHLASIAFPGRVLAATVDHGLRPEAATEAAMVARWCAAHGIAHAILHPVAPVSGNVQAWARGERYALLERWRAEQAIDWVMTAHHADDQIETMLMRLNRGAGVGGLAGVRGRSGRVIRPLLGVRKDVLLNCARAEGLPYIDDPSNRDPRFDRAALRTALEGVEWIDRAAAARSAAALAEADAALVWTAQDMAARHVRPIGDGWLLDRTDLPRELMRRLLLHMLALADPAAVPPRGETLDRAMALAMEGWQSSVGGWLLKGGSTWMLSPAPPRR